MNCFPDALISFLSLLSRNTITNVTATSTNRLFTAVRLLAMMSSGVINVASIGIPRHRKIIYCRVPARWGLQQTHPGLRASTRHGLRDKILKRIRTIHLIRFLLRQDEPGTSHYIPIHLVCNVKLKNVLQF